MEGLSKAGAKLNQLLRYRKHLFRRDYSTPIAETMEALHGVVKAGKARYIVALGVSGVPAFVANRMTTLNGVQSVVNLKRLVDHVRAR